MLLLTDLLRADLVSAINALERNNRKAKTLPLVTMVSMGKKKWAEKKNEVVKQINFQNFNYWRREVNIR